MPATLHWQLRQHLHEFKPAVRLSVLTALLLHANVRLRCYPGIDLLCKETGYETKAVVAAKQWLRRSGAFVLVPYSKRVDEEIALPRRQHVYQLTGVIRVGETVVPYLFMTPEAQQAVTDAVFKVVESKVSLCEVSLSTTKGISSSKGSSIEEDDASSIQDDTRDVTPLPYHIANGLGMTRAAKPETNALVKAVLAHPYWQAFARGWDGLAPALLVTYADITLEACKALEQEATVEEVEALTREKVRDPKRKGDYRLTFVMSDLSGFRARRRAAAPHPEPILHVAQDVEAAVITDEERAAMLADLRRARQAVAHG